jgi:hypothetical protein
MTQVNSAFSLVGLNLPLVLTPGQQVSFEVRFAPQTLGVFDGSMAFTNSAASSPLYLILYGSSVTAGKLGANPASANFGNVATGTSGEIAERLINTGGANVRVSNVAVTGSGFSISGLNLPLTLAYDQTASFSIIYAPQVGGPASGSVSISSNASDPVLTIPLSGAGVAQAALAATYPSINFGTVQVGSSGSKTETLSNTGNSSISINQANISGSGFSLSGLSLPLTLSPGQSFTFTTKFAPVAAGRQRKHLCCLRCFQSNTRHRACRHRRCCRPTGGQSYQLEFRQRDSGAD